MGEAGEAEEGEEASNIEGELPGLRRKAPWSPPGHWWAGPKNAELSENGGRRKMSF